MARLSGLALFALAYAVLLEAMLAAAILFWPEFAASVQAFRPFTEALPVMGDLRGKVEDKGAIAYVLGQHFFKGCNALGTAAAVLFAAPAIAGEAHRGTLEMWLARPVSRTRLLLERVEEYEPYAPYLLCAAHQSLFLLAVYSVTFLCSCLGSNPNRIALSLLFVTVFEFALYMVKSVTHWSLYRLCDMDLLLALAEDGRWNAPVVSTLGATVVASVALSWWVFQRRTP